MAVPSMHVLAGKQPTSGAFDPLSIAWHSVYWAEDPGWTNPGDGNAVTTWDDASGNGRDVTQGTAANRPLYRASVAGLNNQPALDFDGTNDCLGTASSFTATSGVITKVLVLQLKVAAGDKHIWSWNGTGSRCDVQTASAPTRWGVYENAGGGGTVAGGTPDTSAHLLICTVGASSSVELDGTSLATGSSSGASLRTHSIGAYSTSSNHTNTYIAFAGMHIGGLTAGERADLLAWAQDHYGTP